MPRLIDANALMFKVSNSTASKAVKAVCAVFINGAPSVDAVEVVHGRWEQSESMVLSAKCSKCKGWVTKHSLNEPAFNYCPNCGADMRERKDNG